MVSSLVFLTVLLQILPFFTDGEYLIRNFTVEDGLPVNSVNGIVQDDEGYLYFSTPDGLARFDGYDFKVYHSGNTEEMHTNRIGGMLKTDSNEIWMIHPDGTITRKAGSNFKTFGEIQGDFEGKAERFLQAKNGDIWISTTRGIFRFDPRTDSFQAPSEPLLQANTRAIESTIGGGIFTLNKNGLVFWEDGNASVLLENEDFPIPPGDVLQIKQFNINDVWLIGVGGLFKYSLYSQNIDFIYRTNETQSTVWNLHLDSDGTYIINSSEGFYSWEPITQYVAKLPPDISTTTDRTNLVFSGADGEDILLGDNEVLIDGQEVFETEEIQSGFIDREGSLWISTLREGIFQIRKSDFSNITPDDIQGFEDIYPVIQSTDGAVWAGSFVNGIYRITDERTDNWNTSNSSLTGDLCRFLFEDDDSTLYASMWGQGLWMYTGSDWSRIDAIDDLTTPDVTVEAMHRDQQGRLFVGTSDRLVIFENGDFKHFADSSANKFQEVRVIRESRNGTLFMGTNGNGLTILKDGIQRNYTSRNSGLTSDFIRDIYVQSSDTLWLATENLGLNRVILDEAANITSVTGITGQDGLIKNSLHRIIETPDRQLWISSNGGIMRISKNELNRYADGITDVLSVLVFDEKDGMVSREANGGVQTAGMLSADQKLWFPNQKGITIIDPADISGEDLLKSRKPVIEEIVLPDTSLFVEEKSDIQIPGHQRNVRIKFSAPNFSSSGRIQFRYKLEGVNENWENSGQSREAVFTNIPPGTHEFLVQTHSTGNASEISEASILITIRPAFYETSWFSFVIAISGIFVIFGAVKYRTRVLEERERELRQKVDQQAKELKAAAEQKSRSFSEVTHEPFISSPPKNGKPVQPETVSEKPDHASGSNQILIVEENDDFREYLQSIVSEKYRVTAASEGKEALEILEKDTPDIIICDVMMTGINGLEFVNNLRKTEKYQHMPALFLSAKDRETDVETGLSTGADVYLTKPIKGSLLFSQITAVLRRERVLKSNQIEEEKNQENPFVRQARTIIYRQLANPALNVDMLADTLFMSRRKLYNEWKKTGETSLNDFIKKIRLKEAKVLLNEQGFSVQETAMAVGYSDANYFSTSFKKEFGVSPSEVMV